MLKKLFNSISIAQLVIAIIMYFVIASHFETDKIIVRILPHTDFEATLLRLLIYIVPGINIICGFFGLVFSTRSLLSFMGVLEIVAGILTLYFQGKNAFMNTMGIIMVCLGTISIICIQIISRGNKNRENI